MKETNRERTMGFDCQPLLLLYMRTILLLALHLLHSACVVIRGEHGEGGMTVSDQTQLTHALPTHLKNSSRSCSSSSDIMYLIVFSYRGMMTCSIALTRRLVSLITSSRIMKAVCVPVGGGG